MCPWPLCPYRDSDSLGIHPCTPVLVWDVLFFQTPAAGNWLEHRIALAHAARLVKSFVGWGLFHPRIPWLAMLTQDETWQVCWLGFTNVWTRYISSTALRNAVDHPSHRDVLRGIMTRRAVHPWLTISGRLSSNRRFIRTEITRWVVTPFFTLTVFSPATRHGWFWFLYVQVCSFTHLVETDQPNYS